MKYAYTVEIYVGDIVKLNMDYVIGRIFGSYDKAKNAVLTYNSEMELENTEGNSIRIIYNDRHIGYIHKRIIE